MLSDAHRDWSIDDAITENLDLPELLRDYMSQLADPAECETAFRVLRSLTVCDPTVGSGAFLFAALDVLEPLYAEVLARASELEDSGEPAPDFLAEAQEHPSVRYWLIKTICLHNLFGVDLMHEAPEIAKLRLFLKLAAQIDRVEDLEPLPDLDFNIKCGNLLVGIADERDARERLGGGRLDLGGEIAGIESLASHLASAYGDFVEAQQDTTGPDLAAAKESLAVEFDSARGRCDELLHSIRGTRSREQWVEAHQPFHWFVEFPSVWRRGGFDVVIGNPPYIKTSLVTDYTWTGYKTQKCPDLYAVCMERASTLLNDQGRFAMIVMHSLCFSRKYAELRSQLDSTFAQLWISGYWAGRMGLFTGANPRNAIVLGRISVVESSCHLEPNRWTTRYNRWQSESRDSLFDRLEYCLQPYSVEIIGAKRQWPFIDPSILTSIKKMRDRDTTGLAHAIVKQSSYFLGYKTKALYQLGVFAVEPPTVDPKTGLPAITNSNRSGWLHFKSAVERDLALVALAGRWGYLWWLTYSDEFHVTRSTLAAFPGDIERLAKRTPGDMELVILLESSRILQDEMPRQLAWMMKAGVNVGRYNMMKLRHITDRADWILARAWGVEDAFEAAGNLRDRMVFGNKG